MNLFSQDADYLKKIYAALFNDGFLDIAMGFATIMFGLSPYLEQAGIHPYFIYTFILIVAPLISYLGRKYITQPRFGVIRFSAEHLATNRKRNRQILILAVIAIIAGIIGLFTPTTGGKNGINIPFVVAAMCYAMSLCFSFRFEYLSKPRLIFFVIYINAIVVSMALTEKLRMHSGAPYGTFVATVIPGSAMILIGIVLLVRFLQKYPPVTALADDSSGNLP
jgi:hypothetical protein